MVVADIKAILAADSEARPQGKHELLASQLDALANDHASILTLAHLKHLGTGNPRLANGGVPPLMTNHLARVVDALSVVYSTPATRRVELDGELLEDKSPLQRAVNDAFDLSAYSEAWRQADKARNLYRQCVLAFAENHDTQAVDVHVYAPHQVFRQGMGASMEQDDAVLLLLRDAPEEADRRYRLWQREGGGWRSWVVDGTGEMAGVQPYGVEGVPDFDGLPLMSVYDSHTHRMWLPLPESRIASCLSINSQLCDLEYLVTQEAHTRFLARTLNGASIPSKIAPGATIVVEGETDDMKAVSSSPKIQESLEVLHETLQAFAVSESLPPDFFVSGQVLTGDALVAAERALAKRRMEQLGLVPRDERIAWVKWRSVYNAFAAEWGVLEVPERARLRVTPGHAWQPKNAREQQDTLLKDLAAGFISRVDYVMRRYGMSREDAIEYLARVDADAEAYPMPRTAQNPGAMVDGDGNRAALGEGSATRNPAAFNEDIAAGTEGASVIAAVQRG